MIFINYERLPDESDEELIFRICQDKEQIGSWKDVAEIINKLINRDYGESTYRKKFQAFQKMFNANKSKFSDSENSLKELDIKLEQLRKERIKVQTVNIERSRIDRTEARRELYYEFIGNLCNTLPPPEFKPLCINDGLGLEEMEYLLCISDIHYGAHFVSEHNEYSPEIACERFELLSSYVINFIQNHKLEELNIVSLGDEVQGLLRINDLKTNDTQVVKAVVEVSRLIAQFLNEISTYTQIKYYHVPRSNHNQFRALNAKANQLADEDLGYIIGNYIKDLCSANDRITVKLADDGKDYIEIDIPGNAIIAMHGHQIKNYESAIKDLTIRNQAFLDYLIVGHWHCNKVIPSGEGVCSDLEVLVAPSIVGSDPYSDSIMKGCKASAKIFGFSELYGNTETYKFILN